MSHTDDESVPTAAYVLVVLGALSYFCLLFVWFLLPAFLTAITADLSLSSARAGLLVGAVPLTYVPLSILTGLVVDRVGAERAIAVALVLFGTAQVLRGFAGGFWTFLAATVLLGVGATGITFGLPKLVSGLFPSSLLGTMSTVYVMGSYLGTATAYGIGRPVLGPLLGGWRPTFLLSGAGVLCFAVVWTVAVVVYRRRHGGPEADTSPFSPSSFRADVGRVFSNRGMRLLVVVGTAYLLIQHGLQGWLPTILESRGLAAATAGTVATLYVVGQATGSVVIPPASDRLGRRRAAVSLCGLAAVVGIVGLLVGGPLVVTGATIILVGVGTGGISPLLRALPTEMEDVGPELTATAVGLVFAVGEIGGFVGPFLVGSLQDVTGTFAAGLAVLTVGGVAIVAAGAALPEVGS